MGGTASWRPPRTLARQRRSAPRAWGPDQRPRLEHPGTAHTNGIAGGIIANTAPRGTATRPGGVSYRFTFGDLVFDLDMHGGDPHQRHRGRHHLPAIPRRVARRRAPAAFLIDSPLAISSSILQTLICTAVTGQIVPGPQRNAAGARMPRQRRHWWGSLPQLQKSCRQRSRCHRDFS